MTHNISVNAYCIAPARIMAGTAGSYGLERMALTFSEEWKDVAKTVTFYPPKSRPVSVVLTDGDEFAIPHEATAKSGEIPFTVFGFRNGKRIFSVTGEMLILATKNKGGVPSEEPTPSEKEQVLSYVQDVKEMIEKGGADNLLVVTIASSNGHNYASHTAAEIYAFVQGGGHAVLRYHDDIYNSVKIKPDVAKFTNINIDYAAKLLHQFNITINNDGDATTSGGLMSSLKNPNPITFTGAVEATYDGSQPVEVVIPEGGGGNTVHFGEEEPTDAKTGDFWFDESEEDDVDVTQLYLLIETDMLPAVHDASGKILTDENGKIILRY